MIDWILRSIIGYLDGTLQSVINGFLLSFDCSVDLFKEYFPFTVTAYPVIRGIALAILFLILLFQLLRTLTAPLQPDNEIENPVMLIVKSMVYLFLILYCQQIFDLLLNMTQTAYNWILNVDATKLSDGASGFSSFITGINSDATNTLLGGGMVGAIVGTIVVICIGWNFLKVILEAAERYIVVCILYYLSPLPFSTGAARATSNIFKGYCRMIGSQLVLLILNAWGIKAILSAIAVYANNQGKVIVNGTAMGSFFLWVLCVFTFEKAMQKLDEYMHDMGMTVAQTGGGLVEEILAAGQGVGSTVSSVFAGTGVASSKGIVGKAMAIGGGLGFAKAAADTVSTGGTKQGLGGVFGGIARSVAGAQFAHGVASTEKGSIAAKTIGSVANGETKTNGIIADGEGKLGSSLGTASMLHYFGETLGSNASAKISVGKGGKPVIDNATVGSGSLADTALKGCQVSDVTIGGGHITGTALNSSGDSVPFRLDSTATNERPEGDYKTVAAQDGTKWYAQVSQPKYDNGGNQTGYTIPKRPNKI